MFNWFRKKKFDPIPVEHKEKAIEYQQVVGLLCMDIDIMLKCCKKNNDMTREDLLWFIQDLYDKKEEMINNKDSRERRYSATYFLLNIPKMPID